MLPRSRDIGRVRHASTAARQRAHSAFRAAASVLSSGRRPTTPDERVHNVVVGLGGACTACRRGGWDDRPARRAVGAVATAAERDAQAVANERGRDARGSRCARIRRSRRSTSPSKASVGIGHGDATSLCVFCSAGDREPASSATRRVSWSRSSATLKKASWRARASQAPFLRPLWGGLNTRTRPTRAAYTRARVVRGASEPTTNIACRAYSCTARRRCRLSPTKATNP